MGSGPAEVVFSLHAGDDQAAQVFDRSSGPVKSLPAPFKRGRPKGSGRKAQSSQDELKSKNPALPFEFVQVAPGSSRPSKTSQKIIRKYARLSCTHHHVDDASYRTSLGATHQMIKAGIRSTVNIPFLWRQIPGVDPFDTSPIKLEPYMHDLLVHFTTSMWKVFYSLEMRVGCNPVVEYWLPIAFQDEALLHSFIGCADAHLGGYSVVESGPRRLQHLQIAISTVNKRLATIENGLSTGTLAILAILAIYESGEGRPELWRVHMNGLQRIVQLCGGLEKMEPIVLYKLYRADIYGALDTGVSPYFTTVPFPLISEPPCGSALQSEGFNAVAQIFGLDSTLYSCIHHLEDAMVFFEPDTHASLATAKDAGRHDAISLMRPTPAGAAQVRHILTYIQYTLMSDDLRRRFASKQGDSFPELCRITLIFYVLTLLEEFKPSPSWGQHIRNEFRRVLTDFMCQMQSPGHNTLLSPQRFARFSLALDFQLWSILLVSRVMKASNCETKTWLHELFASLASHAKCNILNGWELSARLNRFLWIPSIHDPVSEWFRGELKELSHRNQSAE